MMWYRVFQGKFQFTILILRVGDQIKKLLKTN